MPEPKTFINSSVLIYLLSADAGKADQAEIVLRKGGLISVQVLNEIANVTLAHQMPVELRRLTSMH